MNAFWPYLVLPGRIRRPLARALFVSAGTLVSGAALGQGETAGTATPDGPDPRPPVAGPLPAPPPPRAADAPAPLSPSPLVQPKIDVSVPEPPPSVVRKMHNHDGFYLRTNLGLGTQSAFVATDSTTHPNYTVNGGGLALDLLVGGTPSPGLAIGGGLTLNGVTDGEVEEDYGGRKVGSGRAGLIMLGPFIDGFPTPNRGLHLGGLLGLATGSTTRQDKVDEFKGGGLGMAVWIGHGFWVGKEWSLGGDLKLDSAFLRDSSGPVVLADTMYGVSLSFSALYH